MSKKSSRRTRVRFGPFAGTAKNRILSAGFSCPKCGQAVRKIIVTAAFNDLMELFNCRCGSATAWAMENAPRTAHDWLVLMELLKTEGCEVAGITPSGSIAGTNIQRRRYGNN
jgi:hypothetical protein